MGNSLSRKNLSKRKTPDAAQVAYPDQNSYQTVSIPAVPPLQPFQTLDEFCRLWFSWKKEFLNYINKENGGQAGNRTSGDKLINCLGPVGIEISRTFVFTKPLENRNLDALMQRFDIYCIFGTETKQPKEYAYRYIKELQVKAQRYFPEEEDIVRKKITLELSDWCNSNGYPTALLNTAKYEKLTLMEIANWWRFYEKEVQNRGKYGDRVSEMVINCKGCGNDHAPDACPANGQQCTNCNEQDHLSKRCPKRYTTDCSHCGDDHMIRQCPAYHETCSKCNRRGHFQRKCKYECYFCTDDHPPNRSQCPAQNATCTICHRKGHFAVKCHGGRY